MAAHGRNAQGDVAVELEASMDHVAPESAGGTLSMQITQPAEGAKPVRKAKPKPKGKLVSSLNLGLAYYSHPKKVGLNWEKP